MLFFSHRAGTAPDLWNLLPGTLSLYTARPLKSAAWDALYISYACCYDAWSGITQWHLPLAAPETVVPLVAAETAIAPAQRLMRVMPRSWKLKPLYDILYGMGVEGQPICKHCTSKLVSGKISQRGWAVRAKCLITCTILKFCFISSRFHIHQAHRNLKTSWNTPTLTALLRHQLHSAKQRLPSLNTMAGKEWLYCINTIQNSFPRYSIILALTFFVSHSLLIYFHPLTAWVITWVVLVCGWNFTASPFQGTFFKKHHFSLVL